MGYRPTRNLLRYSKGGDLTFLVEELVPGI